MVLRQSPVMIGRQMQLDAIRETLERADREQRSGVVLVTGEAGIGKTRLVRESAETARQRGMVTLIGRCRALEDRIVPAAAVRDIVIELFALDRDGDAIGPARDVLARLLPGAVSEDPLGADAVVELVTGAIRRLADRAAVLLVIEDLHWADATTRQLFARLATADWLGRVVVLASYRSDELHQRHPLLAVIERVIRSSRPVRVEISPLGHGEVTELCAAIRGDRPDPLLVADIARRSGGNPFLVEELLVEPGAAAIPDTLRSVLLARAASVNEAALGVLRAVAAAGSLPTEVIGDVCGLEPEPLDAALDGLTISGLLVRRGARVGFRHELAREVFDDLAPARSAEVHAAIAASLSCRADAGPAELARHWHAARDLPRALVASVAAGREAARSGAPAEALDHLGRALDLWELVPDAGEAAGIDHAGLLLDAAAHALHTNRFDAGVELAERSLALVEHVDTDREVDALLVLRSLYRYAHRWADCRKVTDRALAATSNSSGRSRVMALFAAALDRYYVSDPTGRALADEAVSIATATGDTESIVQARSVASIWRRGAEGYEFERATVAMCDERTSPEATLRALTALGNRCATLARFRELEAVGERGLELVRRTGLTGPHGPSMVVYRCMSLMLTGRWGDLDVAIASDADLLDELSCWCRDLVDFRRGCLDDPAAFVRRLHGELERGIWHEGLGFYGAAVIECGSDDLDLVPFVDDVLDRMGAGLAHDTDELVAVAIGALADRVISLAPSPPDALRVELRDAAARWIERASDLMVTNVDWGPFDELNHARGLAELARLAGDDNPQRWVEIGDRCRALELPYEEALTRLRAAEAFLAGEAGRTVAAHSQAAEQCARAATLALTLGAAPLLARIEELRCRANLPAVAPSAPASIEPEPDSFGLTEREREVLVLMSEGCSNGEIGKRLYISAKTASSHVSGILRKLGVANRVEAAMAAHRFGLVSVTTDQNR